MNGMPGSQLFDSYYYRAGLGSDYHDHKPFQDFFNIVADRIVREVNPVKVLDAGCAMGYLVAGLRNRGVEAYGLDVSEYAISQARDEIKPYVWVGSVEAPLAERYDLIVCIEVLEHMDAPAAERAIANLCQHADDIIFSSHPTDFKEVTHFNVRPSEYWAEVFAKHGFFRDVDFDATFLTPWAIRVRRQKEPVSRLIGRYERRLARLIQENHAIREITLEQRRALAQHAMELANIRDNRRVFTIQNAKSKVRKCVARVLPRETMLGKLARNLYTWAWRGRRAKKAENLKNEQYERWRRDRLEKRKNLYGVQTVEAGLFSLLTTAWNTPVPYLEVMAQSVLGQDLSGGFEWIVLDNGSTDTGTRQFLERLAREKPVRLHRVERNLGIIGGMRFALLQATGRYIIPMDSDDYLYPDCLRTIAWHIVNNAYPPLLFSDEDLLRDNIHREPFLKPDWDPVLFLNNCYVAHVDAIDRKEALELGAYSDPDTTGSHDWDTFLRFMLAGHRPVHIPEVLYSWRAHPESCAQDITAKPYVYQSHRKVLNRFLGKQVHSERYRIELAPLFKGLPYWRYTRARVSPRPLLTLVLSAQPEKCDPAALLIECNYPQHEAKALHLSEGLPELARHAREMSGCGGWIHLIHESVSGVGNEWPWEVLTVSELHHDVVMVGGRILDANMKILTAGEYFGCGPDCGCPDVGRPEHDAGYWGFLWMQRSVSAVSTLHAVVAADFLAEFLENGSHPKMSLPFLGAWLGAYAARKGKRIVYTPYMNGQVSGPSSWRACISEEERRTFARVHGDLIPDRRFVSPYLSLDPSNPYAVSTVDDLSQKRRMAG